MKAALDSRLRHFASSMRADDSTEEERKLWYLFFKNIKSNFADKRYQMDLLQIFIVPQLNWLLSQMVLSIILIMEKHMINGEVGLLRKMGYLSYVFPIQTLGSILMVYVG